MKKKTLLPLATISLLLLSSCNKPIEYSPSEYQVDVIIDKDDIKDLIVCNLNDLHFCTVTDLDRQFDYIKKVIVSNENKRPDIITLDGDVFMECNKTTVDRIISFFNSLKIPFAFTYGNHDLQGLYSNSYIDNELKKISYKEGKGYSLLLNPLNDNVYGDANYVVNIKTRNDQNTTKFQLYVFDSNTYDGPDYDYIHEDQVNWYEKQVNASKIGDSVVPSLAFFHVPPKEFELAWSDRGKAKNGGIECYENEAWYMGEIVDCPEAPSSIVSKMAELGSTKGLVCAHDHINLSDWVYTPGDGINDIRLIFAMKTGDGIYHDDNLMGASFFTNFNVSATTVSDSFEIKNISTTYDGKIHVWTAEEINNYNKK